MQRNKYLDDLNIPIEKYGTNFVPDNDSRYKTWNEEKALYGFDSRETWNLDQIMIEWLYSHLMMYKEKASQVINLNYYKFDIPVLHMNNKNEQDSNPTWYITQIEEHTELEAIELCVKYFKYYLVNKDLNLACEERSTEKVRCALKILAEIFPALWW